jgi:tetratricopeptide (TPR) repeat protein
MLHLHAKRLDEADAMLREALRIKRAHGQECLDVATDLSNLGIVAMKLERYSESEELQNEALRIQESKLGKESMEASRTLSYLAGLYMASNREDEAEAVYVPTFFVLKQHLCSISIPGTKRRCALQSSSMATIIRLLSRCGQNWPNGTPLPCHTYAR